MPTLDFGNDSEKISEFLKTTLQEFSEKEQAPLTGLELFYALQNGFIDFRLWKDENYQPFQTNECDFEKTLNLPHWEEFNNNLWQKNTLVIDFKGNCIETIFQKNNETFKVKKGKTYPQEAIGNSLVALLENAKTNGFFNSVELHPSFQMGVLDDEDWSWTESFNPKPKEAPAPQSEDDGRIPCPECGGRMLPATAKATGGVCMRCKNAADGKFKE